MKDTRTAFSRTKKRHAGSSLLLKEEMEWGFGKFVKSVGGWTSSSAMIMLSKVIHGAFQAFPQHQGSPRAFSLTPRSDWREAAALSLGQGDSFIQVVLSVAPRPAASISPKNLLEMQIIRSHLTYWMRHMDPNHLCFNNPGNFGEHKRLRIATYPIFKKKDKKLRSA